MTTFSTAHALHIGGRDEQQDAATILHSADDVLLVLADGMGGHAGGQLASSAVVATAEKLWTDGSDRSDPGAFLTRLLAEAHAEINRLGEARGINPRSTGVLVHLKGNSATWTHIGDSRLYRFRGDELLGRTHDHSVVQMLRDMGKITEEEMGNHPDQNRLTHSLGGETDPEPEIETGEIQPGDSFVLCSDGLWEMITPPEMAKAAAGNLKEVVGTLTAEANSRAGAGSDNISVVVARVEGAGAAAGATATASAAVQSGEAATLVVGKPGDTGEDPTIMPKSAAAEADRARSGSGAASGSAAATKTASAKPKRSAAKTSGLAFLLVTVIAAGAVAGIFQPWKSGTKGSAGEPTGAIVPVKRTPETAKPDPGKSKPDPGQSKPDPGQSKPDSGQAKPDPSQAKPDLGKARPKPDPGETTPKKPKPADTEGGAPKSDAPKSAPPGSDDRKAPPAKTDPDSSDGKQKSDAPGSKPDADSGTGEKKSKLNPGKQIDRALGGDSAPKRPPVQQKPDAKLQDQKSGGGGPKPQSRPRTGIDLKGDVGGNSGVPEKKPDGDGSLTE